MKKIEKQALVGKGVCPPRHFARMSGLRSQQKLTVRIRRKGWKRERPIERLGSHMLYVGHVPENKAW